MKFIITESQAEKLKVLRRKDELWDLITYLYPYEYPCDFKSFDNFMDALKIEMFETLSLDWFTPDNMDYIKDMVDELYKDDLEFHYNDNCND